LKELDKNLSSLIRLGHANALDYPLDLYVAAIQEVNENGAG